MGVALGSAVVPIAMCITWSKANKWGCIGGAVSGFCAGVITWLVTTSALNGGELTVTTTGGDLEMLAGNLASIGVGGIITVVTSLIVSSPLPSPPSILSVRFTDDDNLGRHIVAGNIRLRGDARDQQDRAH